MNPKEISNVLLVVSQAYLVKIEDILAYNRDHRVTKARSLVYWILRNRFQWSFGQIAKAMQRERHTILSVSRGIDCKMMHFPKLIIAVDEMIKGIETHDARV